MAQILPKNKYNIPIILLFSLFFHSHSYQFSRNLSQKSFELGKQKLSHLHFYFQDIRSGKNPTVVPILDQAIKTNSSGTQFGAVVMIDDQLTVGPELTSKIVGRAQGLYAFCDLNEFGLIMVMNFVFTEGKYNGSTLSILGKNAVLLPVREMPIVGGTGVFRFARGYVLAKTHSLDVIKADAVIEYDVYVQH